MSDTKPTVRCECQDTNCPAHVGKTYCFRTQKLTGIADIGAPDVTVLHVCPRCKRAQITTELFVEGDL